MSGKRDQGDEPMTCGRGLAEHSVIPAKLGELIAALAENLELHVPALVLTDHNAKLEQEAYVKLAAEHRAIAEQLTAVAAHMAGYRNLPMGVHDPKVMQDPARNEAFGRYVKLERELIDLLQKALERDQELLA
jgi:hypothetical protein